MKAEEELVNCRKCGMPHRIDKYRNVKYTVCPVVNRVMLVLDTGEAAHAKETNEGGDKRSSS